MRTLSFQNRLIKAADSCAEIPFYIEFVGFWSYFGQLNISINLSTYGLLFLRIQSKSWPWPFESLRYNRIIRNFLIVIWAVFFLFFFEKLNLLNCWKWRFFWRFSWYLNENKRSWCNHSKYVAWKSFLFHQDNYGKIASECFKKSSPPFFNWRLFLFKTHACANMYLHSLLSKRKKIRSCQISKIIRRKTINILHKIVGSIVQSRFRERCMLACLEEKRLLWIFMRV